MRYGWFMSAAFGLCVACVSSSAFAMEPWADGALPVRGGLELWLDATTLANSATSNGEQPPASESPIERWRDGSGAKRDLRAVHPESAPTFRNDLLPKTRTSVVRFDGADDALVNPAFDLKPREITLFIVATPRANPGAFRAVIAGNERGRNDYVTGFNVDLGPGGTDRFDTLNVEGIGFGGATNLMADPQPMGTFHQLTLTAGPADVALAIDGKPAGKRDRAAAALRLDELRLGARCYRNDGQPSETTGFFVGDVAEVLLYSRALSAKERGDVEAYLRRKHEPLWSVTGPPPEPPLRFLSPGFEIREIPVSLTNVNDLLYLPDGRLLAVGYDGRIHALRDADGDGLEDAVDVFWDKPGLQTPMAAVATPEGIVISAMRKIVLLRDDDGDGKPDREEIVLEGWQPPTNYSGGVDALGMALAKDGSLYFALGCSDFTNAYLVKDGKSAYDLRGERGTIVKLSPDRKRREIVATGLRFPVSLAFDRHGELFCTDQEGETWLPHGNPLDELIHVVPGKHYGFPPRDPRYLTNVFDEPAVVEFGPQHQSTCGLAFNDADAGRPIFGPERWRGDGLVVGYARGKLWRAPIARTRAGAYVGRSSLLAVSRLLLLDVALAPDGAIALAAHGGAPDWGSGPRGQGRLFKVHYRDRRAPMPVIAWPASPVETRVAFDPPIDPAAASRWLGATIEYGVHVRAADRWELLRPGYASVQAQLRAPRRKLRVVAAQAEDDGRTLKLTTDPHPARGAYALTLPGARAPGDSSPGSVIDLAYDLTGVEASWTPANGDRPAWIGWLPTADLDVALTWTRGSAAHDRLAALVKTEGRLRLRTRIDAPASPIQVRVESSAPFEATLDGHAPAESAESNDNRHGFARWRVESGAMELRLSWPTGPRAIAPMVTWAVGEDPSWRPLPSARQLVPWAPAPEKESETPAPAPELAGADPARGEAIFFSKEARCSGCHRVRGKGEAIGPDLSNLTERDAGSILRDISQPSAAINPEFLPYTLELQDGRALAGLVRAESGDRLRIIDADAQSQIVAREEIADMRPGDVSIMPKGLDQALGPEKTRDLVAFLSTKPDVAPRPIGVDPPPARTREELEAVFGPLPERLGEAIAMTNVADWPTGPGAGDATTPFNIVLVAGPKDHGPGEHDYPRWQRQWEKLLRKAPGVRVSTAFEWPDRSQLDLADVLVFYYWNHDWSDQRYRELDAFQARGGGVVAMHSATVADKAPGALAERIGFAFQPGRSKFRHGALKLDLLSQNHPITKGMPKSLSVIDESYWVLSGELSRSQTLIVSEEESHPRPMLWTFEKGEGRVVGSILGHYLWTFDDPLCRALMLRSICWSGRQPIDRLTRLAIVDVALRLPTSKP